MKTLRNKFLRLLNTTSLQPKRFLFEHIDWKERFIIIKGQRGVGKTTLLLQRIKLSKKPIEETLYISLDDMYFTIHTLSDFVEEFVINGGKYLYIDEIHRYKNWSLEIKNIYDFYPNLQLIITGSSALSFYINASEIGRRAAVYHLPELSFREYLIFNKSITFSNFTLEEIVNNNEIVLEINKKINPVKEFHNYMKYGAYPFILEGKERYYTKLESVINTVIDNDIPAIENISYSSRTKLRKLLYMMAYSVPLKINISELSRKIETSRDMLLKYLELLNKSGILKFLSREGMGYTVLRKPDKIYFSNTNLLYALNMEPEIGTARETFFLSQISVLYQTFYPKKGDFYVNNQYVFEIGEKNKSSKQIQELDNAYLALDNIEYAQGNQIPIWLFGFLY